MQEEKETERRALKGAPRSVLFSDVSGGEAVGEETEQKMEQNRLSCIPRRPKTETAKLKPMERASLLPMATAHPSVVEKARPLESASAQMQAA